MLLAILYYNSQDGVFNTPGKCLTLVLLINNMFTNSGSGPMGAVASITGWSRCALTGNKSRAIPRPSTDRHFRCYCYFIHLTS